MKKLNPGLTDEMIIETYQRHHSLARASEELGIPPNRISYILMKHDIPRDGIDVYRNASQCYPDFIQAEILRLHTDGVSQKDLRTKFGGSLSSIRQAIIRNGGKLQSNTPRISSITDEMIIDSYQKTQSAAKTSQKLGVSRKRIYYVLFKNDIPRNGLDAYRDIAQCYSDSIQMEILRLHVEGMSIEELRIKFGGSTASIRQAIIRMGGEIQPGITTRKKTDRETEKLICELYQSGLSQAQISIRVEILQQVISRILFDNGIQIRGSHPKRENHPQWKGGINYTEGGYRLIRVDDDDFFAPMRSLSGYILEHRLVMARKLGRLLDKDESVHHIDGDRLNNHPDNLQLRQGRHGKGAAFCCLDCGSHNVRATPISDPPLISSLTI